MKRLSILFAAVFSFTSAIPVFAGVGNISDNGPHYNLNIIGVAKGKTVDMTDSQRHTIFVPLNTAGYVDGNVKISYVRAPAGEGFAVLDGNATDKDGAIIQVPYEYCTDLTTGCQDLLSYNVYAVALGKPGGSVLVNASCTYDTNVLDSNGISGTCTDTLLMNNFTLTRDKGQPKPQNISDIFRASGCLDLDSSGTCNTGDITFSNIWIFNIQQLTDYFWTYDNDGLKHMQIRFYPTVSGTISIVK